MNNGYKITDVDDLKEGMILGEDLYDSFGNILLSDGIVLKKSYILKIKEYNISKVYIEDSSASMSMYEENKDIKDPYLLETRLEAKKFVKEAMGKIYIDDSLSQKALKIVKKLIEELISNDEIVVSLGKLRKIDDYTLEHSVNVCIISLFIGMTMEIEHKDLIDLGIGAILHDIGKMMIPKNILNKPGPLTIDEYKIIKNHTTYGYEILKKSKGISEVAAQVALNHHERLDGNGYPIGKKGKQINIYSKIVAISDVYDALTSDRVYKKKVEAYKALEYICKMVNIQFDNEIVKRLISCIGIYPLGSIVKLNTNELGLVVDINKIKPSKPVIRILLDEKGKKPNNYLEVDTNKNPTITITGVIPKYDGNLKFL